MQGYEMRIMWNGERVYNWLIDAVSQLESQNKNPKVAFLTVEDYHWLEEYAKQNYGSNTPIDMYKEMFGIDIQQVRTLTESKVI